ncbi:MAG: hypothetical protein ABIM88_07515 [candidate division WOR-3 bacterium]
MRRILLFGILGLSACHKTEPAEAGMVLAYIFHISDNLDEIDVFIYSDPLANPSECRAFLNDWEIPGEWFRNTYGAVYLGVLVTGLELLPGYIAQLAVESNVGGSEGTLNMPDTLSFVSHPDSDTVAVADLSVSWTKANDADFYDFWVGIIGYTPSGTKLGERYIYFFTKDTSYTLPRDSIVFSGNYGYSEILFDIDPCAGVMPEPGARTNMTGDIRGNFYLINTASPTLFLYAGTPAKAQSKGFAPRESFQNRVEEYLRFR